ncbi:MAG: type IV pilin protein [Patescibacteria group bacterium]
MTNQKGFTLIELLVVVAIIGILSGIAFVSISGARESAYDTQIQSELSQIRSNAEQYYYDNGGTYAGYDSSDGWSRIYGEIPMCSVALLEGTDPAEEYQISIEGQSYAAWAPLCAASEGSTVYYCVDSEGNAGEYEGTPDDSQTSCENIFTTP